MAIKKITELTLAELQNELGKRGLDKSGDKSVLLARLRKTLLEDANRKKAAAAAESLPAVSAAQEATSTAAAQEATSTAAAQEATSTDGTVASENQVEMTATHEPMESTATQKPFEKTEADSPEQGQMSVTETPVQQAVTENPAAETPNLETSTDKDDSSNPKESDASNADASAVAEESEKASRGADDDDVVYVSMVPAKGNPITNTSLTGTVKDPVRKEKPTGKIINASGTAAKIVGKSDSCLWVNGLPATVKAAELKQAFAKYGKVVSAKIVTSAKNPGSKCYGFLTMVNSEEANKCINHLNNTKLLGNQITVELDSKRNAHVVVSPPPTTSVWISGLPTGTKAADLKALCVSSGKVIAAKVVASSKSSSSNCFGLITMSSIEEADKCIANINNTDFKGSKITAERAKSDAVSTPVKSTNPTTATDVKSDKVVANNKLVKKAPIVKKPVVGGFKSSINKPRFGRFGNSGPVRRPKVAPLMQQQQQQQQQRQQRMNSFAPGRGSFPPGRGPFGNNQRGGFGNNQRGGFGNNQRGGFGNNQREMGNRLPEREMAREMRLREQALRMEEQQRNQFMVEEHQRVQREEAARLAFEREQLHLEKMQLEREKMEAERVRILLQQEASLASQKREREMRWKEQNSLKRQAESDGSYWGQPPKRQMGADNYSSHRNEASFGSSHRDDNARGFDDFKDRRSSEQWSGGARNSDPSHRYSEDVINWRTLTHSDTDRRTGGNWNQSSSNNSRFSSMSNPPSGSRNQFDSRRLTGGRW